MKTNEKEEKEQRISKDDEDIKTSKGKKRQIGLLN